MLVGLDLYTGVWSAWYSQVNLLAVSLEAGDKHNSAILYILFGDFTYAEYLWLWLIQQL